MTGGFTQYRTGGHKPSGWGENVKQRTMAVTDTGSWSTTENTTSQLSQGFQATREFVNPCE